MSLVRFGNKNNTFMTRMMYARQTPIGCTFSLVGQLLAAGVGRFQKEIMHGKRTRGTEIWDVYD